MLSEFFRELRQEKKMKKEEKAEAVFYKGRGKRYTE